MNDVLLLWRATKANQGQKRRTKMTITTYGFAMNGGKVAEIITVRERLRGESGAARTIKNELTGITYKNMSQAARETGRKNASATWIAGDGETLGMVNGQTIVQ